LVNFGAYGFCGFYHFGVKAIDHGREADAVVLAVRRRARNAGVQAAGGFDEALGAGTRFPCEDIDAVAAAVWSGVPGAYMLCFTCALSAVMVSIENGDDLVKSYVTKMVTNVSLDRPCESGRDGKKP
jgi:hypothetical protein